MYFTLHLHLLFNSTFYFGAYFIEQYASTIFFFTIHISNIMRQHHEQQQERIRLKNQTKALYQATRRANPVVRSLEQSSDTARRRIAREEPGVREYEQPANTTHRAVARDEPGVR